MSGRAGRTTRGSPSYSWVWRCRCWGRVSSAVNLAAPAEVDEAAEGEQRPGAGGGDQAESSGIGVHRHGAPVAVLGGEVHRGNIEDHAGALERLGVEAEDAEVQEPAVSVDDKALEAHEYRVGEHLKPVAIALRAVLAELHVKVQRESAALEVCAVPADRVLVVVGEGAGVAVGPEDIDRHGG